MNTKAKFNTQLEHFAKIAQEKSYIDPSLYDTHNIKRGLRNKNGTGVLVGITKIANVKGYKYEDNKKIPTEGDLDYRGYSIIDIIRNVKGDKKFIFEEVCYLLLFDKLPNESELEIFKDVITDAGVLPKQYLEDVILRIPSKNLMNKLQRAVLALYSYDEDPDNTSIINVMRQSISLIAKMPLIMAYSYRAKKHYIEDESLVIHKPKEEYSLAENILHLIRDNKEFTKEEASILDMMLVLHAEHGGGNNSAFATHVVSSTGTDTYSAISTALGSLKGPRHGGANLMVTSMIDDIKENVKDYDNEAKLTAYLNKILDGEAFNNQGLIYGIGHAVYTLSDPRSILLKEKAEKLAMTSNYEREFNLIKNIEEIGGKLVSERAGKSYPTAANIDLYSGIVYEMLGIPRDLFTPLFGVSRTAGWCAHRIEQVLDSKIMRPAYVTLHDEKKYEPIENR